MTEVSDVSQRKQVVSGSIAKTVQMVLGFLVVVYLARILPSSEFGLYFFFLSIVHVTDGPITGFASAAQKRFSETGSDRREIVGAVLILTTVVSAIFFIGALIVAEFTRTLNEPSLLGILFFSVVASNAIFRVYLGTGKVGQKNWIEFGRSVVRSIIQVILATAGFGAFGLIVGMSVASALTVPIILFLFGFRPEVPSIGTIKSLWAFAKYSMVSGVVSRASNQIDKVIIGFFLTTVAVSQYEVTYRLMMPALLMTGVIQSGLFSRISNLDSKNESIDKEVSRNLSFSSVLSLPMFFGSVAIGESLVSTIFGSQYTGLGVLVAMMGLYKVIESQTSPLLSILGGLDEPKILMYINLATSCLNIVIALFLIQIYGILGVLFSSIISNLLKYIILYYSLKSRMPDLDLFPHYLKIEIISGAGMFAIVTSFNNIFRFSGTAIFGLVGLGVFIYSIAIFLWIPDFRHFIRQVLSS
ncbi:oligosaccharide flippase family protein [Halapricum desulfuricans]|uniref:MATE family membrane protein, Rfbx family n=1 Tax=Halapricum desulfuricans TaxID=2841257 RepID=A0A897NRV6_9EURY|nr:oligosaccharide flippase family protein [Halapricum desulfuricans]QSG14971.1 MATE family membrane protein, Rfbx family [Halapricum desulfuricans]